MGDILKFLGQCIIFIAAIGCIIFVLLEHAGGYSARSQLFKKEKKD